MKKKPCLILLVLFLLIFLNSCDKKIFDIVGVWAVAEVPIFSFSFSGSQSAGIVTARLNSCPFQGTYVVSDKNVDFSFITPDNSDEECEIEEGTWTFSGEFTDENTITGEMRRDLELLGTFTLTKN